MEGFGNQRGRFSSRESEQSKDFTRERANTGEIGTIPSEREQRLQKRNARKDKIEGKRKAVDEITNEAHEALQALERAKRSKNRKRRKLDHLTAEGEDGVGQARSELQARIDPLQKVWEAINISIDKHPLLGPVQQEFNRLETPSDVSPSESSSNKLWQKYDVRKFFEDWREFTDTLTNANVLLLDKNIYASADDRLQDDGEKARDKLLQMSRDLEKISPEKLNRAFEKADICSYSDKISERFDSWVDVFLYWQVHLEYMKSYISQAQYNTVTSAWDVLKKKYFLSFQRDSNLKPLLSAESSNDLKQRLHEMDRDDKSLRWLRQIFLTHTNKILTVIRDGHRHLSERWKHSEEEMRIAFGENMYNTTQEVLTNIAARNYPSEVTSLELAGNFLVCEEDLLHIRAIEAELQRKERYEERYPEKKGKPLPRSLADFLPHERRNDILEFIKLDISPEDVGSPCTSEELAQMQNSTKIQSEKEYQELTDGWPRIMKHNPILKSFPKGHGWRLLIDGELQRHDLVTSLAYMNVSAAQRGNWEIEPYFMKGQIKALRCVFTALEQKQPLTAEYYWRLHVLSLEGSAFVRQSTQGDLRKYPGDDRRFLLIRLSESGDPYVARKNYPIHSDWYTQRGYEELCNNYACRNGGDPRYGDLGHPIGRALADDPATIVREGEIFFNPFTEEEAKAHVNGIFEQYYKDIHQARQRILRDHGQQAWTPDLVKSLSENEIREILTPIACCSRELELSHVFRDANGRLAGFILPIHMCLENHILPPIMLPNPWIIDRAHPEEIVDAILEGQKRTSSYMVE